MIGDRQQYSSPPEQRLELRIDSDPAKIRVLREKVEAFARTAGMAQEGSDAVGLALNEALANVIRHGYGGAKDKPILVTLTRISNAVRIEVRDWSTPFDPAKLPDPYRAIVNSPDDLRPGGLGLLCIRKMMDEVAYLPQTDGMLLVMVKRIGR